MSGAGHEQEVEADEAGIRLDRWFKRHHPTLSHSALQKLLRTGQVRVDGKRAESSTRLEAAQKLRVPPQVLTPPPPDPAKVIRRVGREVELLRKMILFEDDDVIALNKPAGLAVQGGTGLKENLDDMLEALAKKGQGKPKLVHRIDRDTSGVLLVARSAFAAMRLTEAFRERETRKIYWGVTVGVPKPPSGKVAAHLIKQGETMRLATEDEIKDSRRKDYHGGVKTATTLYQVVDRAAKKASFIAMWPLSGRTHQLRVHMAYVGTPLLGDRLYGADASAGLPLDELGSGLHLHARRLVIPHPRRGVIDVTAPLGPEMRKTWDWFHFDPNEETEFVED
ncbi:MAG: RluA family pseudouridine synthase [Bdellovibrionales bacterium]